MHLIAGATGYIGGLLAERLVEEGRDVRCLARDPDAAAGRLDGRCEIVRGDVLDRASLDDALTGVDVAYYLVHSMGRGGDSDFEERDRRGARNFAEAAAGGRRRADRLPRRTRRADLATPALAARDRGAARLDGQSR